MRVWLRLLCCVSGCLCSLPSYAQSIVYDHLAPSDVWGLYGSAPAKPQTSVNIPTDADTPLGLTGFTQWCVNNNAVVLFTGKQFYVHYASFSLNLTLNTNALPNNASTLLNGNINTTLQLTLSHTF